MYVNEPIQVCLNCGGELLELGNQINTNKKLYQNLSDKTFESELHLQIVQAITRVYFVLRKAETNRMEQWGDHINNDDIKVA